MNKSKIKLTTVLFLLVSSLVNAQIVAFSFGTSGAPTTSATTTAANISLVSSFSSNLGTGATTNSSPGSSTAGGSGGSYFSANTWRTSDGNYFAVTITPAAGYQVTLTGLSFYYLSTSSGPTSATLASSADTYASTLASYSLTKAPTTPVAADWHLGSLSTSLTFNTATTLRIYGLGASSSAGAFRIDDVSFSGDVALTAVPEPSTFAAALGAMALIGAMIHRRHRARLSCAT